MVCRAAAIFAADTLTDLEIAAAILYVAVVLMSVRFCDRRGLGGFPQTHGVFCHGRQP